MDSLKMTGTCVLPTDNRALCPNSSVRDTPWYPAAGFFYTPVLMAYLPYLRAQNSWVLDHCKDFTSTYPMPGFVLVFHPLAWTLLKQHDAMVCWLWMENRKSLRQSGLTLALSLDTQVCSWTALGRQKAHDCSSNFRTFHLISRHYTHNGWGYKTIKWWWHGFWQTAK